MTTTPQHTPGPWIEHNKDGDVYPIGNGETEVAIAYTAANARLIAAAPTMLAILRQALNALNTAPRFKVGDTDSYAVASRIERVIANTAEQE